MPIHLPSSIPIEIPSMPERGFNRIKPIRITTRTTKLTDYQVAINSNASNFAFGKARSDGADIRFRDVDGKSLSYWIESWASTSAKIWVKLDELEDYEERFIYMIYGNCDGVSGSNGNNTFLLYDECNSLSKWTEHNGGTGMWQYHRADFDSPALPGHPTKKIFISSTLGTTVGVLYFTVEIVNDNDYMFAGWLSQESNPTTIYHYDDNGHMIASITSYVTYQYSHQLAEGGVDSFAVGIEHIEGGAYKFELKSRSGYQQLIRDGVSKNIQTETHSFGDFYVGFGAVSAWDAAHDFYLDDVRVRKYAVLEPLVEIL